MRLSDVCVIGAGPYGLTVAAHLRAAGVEVRVFGKVMSFWRAMPAGMLLRSSREGISLSDPSQALSLNDYERLQAKPLTNPVGRAEFVRYAEWFQRHAVPDVDPRRVIQIERCDDGFELQLSDGEIVRTRRMVVATGMEAFARRLSIFAGLPSSLVTHSLDQRATAEFRDRQVLIIGAGQSALEAAALLNQAGARVEMVMRSDRIHWLAQANNVGNERGLLEHLLYPPGAIGPPGINLAVKYPWLFRSLPNAARKTVFNRAVRPAGSDWIRSRFGGVVETYGRMVTHAEVVADGLRVGLCDGSERTVDHVVQGTGFEIDVARFGFLSDQIVREIKTIGRQPRLNAHFESSVPGLHFLGAASDLSFGPLMRAIAGTGHAARSVTREAVADQPRVIAPRWTRPATVEQSLGRMPTLASTSPAAAAGIALVTHALTGDTLIVPHDR